MLGTPRRSLKGISLMSKLQCIFLYMYFLAFMCSDEETNCYFDGVTWSVGDCIECRCIKGLISCNKTMTFVTSTTEQRIEQCSQPNCNIVDFLNSQKQVCKGKQTNRLTGWQRIHLLLQLQQRSFDLQNFHP